VDLHHDLTGVLTTSRFEIIPGVFAYARAATSPEPGDCFLVATDSDETTVVAEAEKLDRLNIIERHPEEYALIALHVSVPFYAVGFLASITSALAKRGLNVLVVSTFTKDYVLVRQDRISDAAESLIELGLHEAQARQTS
jgi:hypothetical protein